MASLDDKKAFSERLQLALKRSSKDVGSATQLAMQFNLRHPNEPITVQAAQKWLTGKARPTADKVETLAHWLSVSPQWLSYGFVDTQQSQLVYPHGTLKELEITLDEIAFLTNFKSLNEYQQHLIVSLVEQLSLKKDFQE